MKHVSRLKKCLIIFLLLQLHTPVLATDNVDLEKQRKDFLAAERALSRNEITRFNNILEGLESYPLYPYLQYQFLKERITRASENQIHIFLIDYADTPLESSLWHLWISTLAKQGRWKTLIRHYHPTVNVEKQCYYRWALYKTGEKEQAFNGIGKLWLVGHSQPRACDRIFTAWQHSGLITQQQAWQRFKLAVDAGNIRLARYLVQFLEDKDQHWANLWLKVHKNPDLILSEHSFINHHAMRNTILLHGLKRIARNDPDRAIDIWHNTLTPRYTFTDEQTSEIDRFMAMTLAIKGKSESLSWLAVIEDEPKDKQLREWRVRASLHQQNWDAALAWIYQLNEEEQLSNHWQYWQARILEELSQHEQADEIYNMLSQTRSYHGFLAADRLDKPYHLGNQVIDNQQTDIEFIEHLPGIRRTRELFLLNRINKARSEWYYATQNMDEEQLLHAAKLAQSWGWHDRAILTVARTSHRDDLDLRFPLAYEKEITGKARENNIEPALAFSIIRQESAFDNNAYSDSGAMGLMQLLPSTARQLAKNINQRFKNKQQLFDVDLNLQYGMSYLRKIMKKFNEHPLLATAAYNAGHNRVKKWIPQESIIQADIWAETIPYGETRDYIQNIMAYMPIYEQRLSLPITTLQNRMLPISSAVLDQ